MQGGGGGIQRPACRSMLTYVEIALVGSSCIVTPIVVVIQIVVSQIA